MKFWKGKEVRGKLTVDVVRVDVLDGGAADISRLSS